jgi:hypothetical protein
VRECAEYYGVVFRKADPVSRPACVIHTGNRDKEGLEGRPEPEVIVISKPAFHDAITAVRGYAGEHRFQLNHRLMAFEVFESP